jgi:chromatin remodeling complex protein RSC6
MATLDSIAKEIKAIHKDIRKIRAHLEDPTGEKVKARAQNNGFNKPLDITPELRAFLALPDGEKISRSQVTRRVNEYVEEKGLKKGQEITLDATLKKLLAPPDDMKITFLNIQKYINPHYIKEEKAPAAPKVPKAAAAAPAAPVKVAAARPKVEKK